MTDWAKLIGEIKGEHTQVEFAKILGVAQSTVSDILRRKRAPGQKFLRGLLRYAPERREELLALFLSQNIGKQNCSKRRTEKEAR